MKGLNAVQRRSRRRTVIARVGSRKPRRGLRARVAACAVLIASSSIAATPASAASATVVSLTFDNNTISQYTLAYQQALQPHNAHATFFANSGTIGSSVNFMSWTQLGTVAAAGNDVGGKTVNATNLTTDPNASAQVCNDRAALLQHGLTPIAFAYPGGSQNANVQAIVKACGYGNARTAAGLSATGATYAETNPPTNWFATRAYAPAAVTLANMQSLVTGASSHGGGWDQIVIGKVCSQSLDPSNYSACSASSGHIELADLNSFLDWVAAAGQTGGAPAGVTLDTVAHFVSAADSSAPTTTISCNGTACSNSPYPGIVSITLAATDVGSGVSSTRYTTDGSDPTLSSTAYTGAFSVNGSSSSTTVKFRSWDYAGNAETTRTQVVQAPPDTTAPTTAISCNAAGCSTSPYVGSVSVSFSATDTGGSGVDKTYYTTDGSPPTTASTVYAGPFQLGLGTYSVRFFSTDKAGNAETANSQQITVVSPTTDVTLAFDDGAISGYSLAYQQALQPHGAHATFFVNSGLVGSTTKFMSWAQLSEMQAAGNDIGSKTVHGTNLTTTDTATATSEVCNDRTALMQHGIDPVAFGYPFGASSTSVKAIVKGCGLGNGRTAGSVSPTGPTYAETIPPKDWFATRAYAPTGQLSLASMEALVQGAATRGGGWDQIVLQKVCSQAQDPSNYATCTAASSWIELADLNSFLDWMSKAGQPGGAPAGALLATARTVVVGADATPPSTTILCDGSLCPAGAVPNVVHATLSATDVGSSVASTHYTTDGTDPTLSSLLYSKAIPITSPTTLKFRSWDFAGNAETIQSQFIQATPPQDSIPPTTQISCSGAPCAGPYTSPVNVVLTATDDPGGWGVDKTYFTTDGSPATTSSPVYTGPFTLKQTTTVNFFSTDLAGNAEHPSSQAISFKTVVTLTFDDGDLTQYDLAFTHALQPHGVHGTFYINSGALDIPGSTMTYAQLTTLNVAGNEIAGHTLNEYNLKTSTDTPEKIRQVCDDHKALVDHGLSPVSFAYPFGAYDIAAEQIVSNCGYATARAAGGIDGAGDGAGPVYAEPIPPKDPLATRTVYLAPLPPANRPPPMSLTHLESSVTSAAQNGGGWVTFAFHQICSQTLDPANYNNCVNDWGPIELDTLNTFLDWMQNAGQPGGAPAGTLIQRVRDVTVGPDTTPPVSTISCDGLPCAGSYHGETTIRLAATDTGGAGVAKTYYTTDGTAPTTSSAVYTGPFIVTQGTPVQFFSTDNDGNMEQPQSVQVQIVANIDPVIASAGDIACDPTQPAFNNGDGTATDCRAKSVANQITGVDALLPLGDNQYMCGGPSAFQQSYDKSWGRFLPITHPVPGDKDYATAGGTDCPSTPGAGYYAYFGSRAGIPGQGYYSYNLGTWHVIALNTGPCGTDPSFCAAGSAQDQWLQADLAANAASSCTLAYYQNPRYVSTPGGGDSTYQPLWQDLYTAGADVVLNGDSHWYERFAPMNASGASDASFGIHEFIVGTGGAPLDTPSTPLPTSQVLNNNTHGVIKLTLHAGSFDWTFAHDTDGTFTDSGTATCHPAPDNTPPTTTITCNGAPCTSMYTVPVQVTLSATDNVFGRGVDKTYYTTDGSTPTTSSTVYTGPFTVPTSAVVSYFSTDLAGNQEPPHAQPIVIDATPPSTTIACNGAACSSGWHNTPVQITLQASDNAGGSGVSKTYYTTDGSPPTTSSTVYSGPFTVQSTVTVSYFSTDAAGNQETPHSQLIQIDPTTPTTSIACNGAACSSGWYTANVQVTLQASDNAGGSGVSKTYYTTDGSTPTTSSTVYTAPFTVASTSTVKFFSTDVAGNAEAVKSQLIQIDPTAPTTTIACNGAACSSGWYTANVQVTLPSTDNPGGSGVSKTYYTTDGSTPTTSSTVYAGPFTLTATSTVEFFSTDMAGNAEAAKSQLVQIDKTAPTTTIACNGAACSSGWYKTNVQVTLAATDTGGSGVSKTYYTTNGSTPTTSSTVYSGSFTLSATSTVKFFSTDVVGNAEAVKSQLVQIDKTAPTTTIACNGAACSSGWYTVSVQVKLTGTDTGGSGLAHTLYTTDGSDPTTSGTALMYSGPFSAAQTLTVKFFSVDNAGNAEAVKSQSIKIDGAAPTVTITQPAGGATYNGGSTVNITAVATDIGTGSGSPSGIARVTFYVDGKALSTDTQSPYTASWHVPLLFASGNHTITAVATDAAGNTKTSAPVVIRVN